MYDLCIVGAGMVGSAAARHASLTSGFKVCLIGPSEPKERNARENREVYGSYYDEGRITWCCDQDIVWASLAKESIKRYRDLEKKSGIRFYFEVGDLMIGGEKSDFLTAVAEVTTKGKIATDKLNNTLLNQRFPYLNLTTDSNGILETRNAGYINPRNIVEAQQIMATKQGCTIIDDVVRRVTRTVHSDGSYIMLVETERGQNVQTRKVLLATGAFTTFNDLLAGNKPEQIITPLSVSFVEVEEKDHQLLRDMPCVIYKGSANNSWKVPSSSVGKDIFFYMLPPIKYPDGRYYIKLGLQGSVRGPMTSSTDVKKWFDEGNPTIEKEVAEFTMSLFKGLEFKSWKGDSCVITETPTTRPYIDMLHAQLGVAIGGNGYAAKSSDEIGRLAAIMVLGKWDSEIARDVFRLRTIPQVDTASFPSFKAKL